MSFSLIVSWNIFFLKMMILLFWKKKTQVLILLGSINYLNANDSVRSFNLTIGSIANTFINSTYEDIYRVRFNAIVN